MERGQTRAKQGCLAIVVVWLITGVVVLAAAAGHGLDTLFHTDATASWFASLLSFLPGVALIVTMVAGIWAIVGLLDAREGR